MEDLRCVDSFSTCTPLRQPAKGSIGRPGGEPCAVRVLALHGSASSPQMWRDARTPGESDSLWITPALMGYESGDAWPPGAPVSLDAEARRLAPLLGVKQDRAVVVGHSYGAAVALQLALRWPHRVSALVLYEPARFALLRMVGAGDEWREIQDVGTYVQQAVARGQAMGAAALFVRYWAGDDAWEEATVASRERVMRWMPKVAAEFHAVLGDEVMPNAYSALQMPVHVLSGDRSPRPAVKVAATLAQACKLGRLWSCPEAGHLGPIYDIRCINPALEAAVTELPFSIGDVPVGATS